MDRKALGLRMHNWHASMNDPVYMVGSFYVENEIYPDQEVVNQAQKNIHQELGVCKNEEDMKELLSILQGLASFINEDYF